MNPSAHCRSNSSLHRCDWPMGHSVLLRRGTCLIVAPESVVRKSRSHCKNYRADCRCWRDVPQAFDHSIGRR